MQIRDELEKYLDAALRQPELDIADLVHHALLLGVEIGKHSQGLFPFVLNKYHKGCTCEICSRHDGYVNLIYALCDLVFLLVRDHIEEEVVLTLSPHAKIPSSDISGMLSSKYGIKLTEVIKTKFPNHIDAVFSFCGALETEAALRDFPLTFTAKIELNNPYGVGIFCSAGELTSNIVRIHFMDEYELCRTNPVAITSFYDSLPHQFRTL